MGEERPQRPLSADKKVDTLRNFAHPLRLSVKFRFRSRLFSPPSTEHLLSGGAARDFVCCPGGCLLSRLLPFYSCIAHPTPAPANRPSGFRPPQFSQGCRNHLFLKIGSPEKVARNPMSLALEVPRLCAHNLRERHSPRLSALRRRAVVQVERQAKSRLDSGCGSGSTQAEAVRKQKKGA